MKTVRADDARKLDHQVLEALRQRAVQAWLRGCSIGDIARVYGMHHKTVSRWIKIYEEQGSGGLAAKPITGRPRKNLRRSGGDSAEQPRL